MDPSVWDKPEEAERVEKLADVTTNSKEKQESTDPGFVPWDAALTPGGADDNEQYSTHGVSAATSSSFFMSDAQDIWGSSSAFTSNPGNSTSFRDELDFGAKPDNSLEAVVRATTDPDLESPTYPTSSTQSINTWAIEDGLGAWGGGLLDQNLNADPLSSATSHDSWSHSIQNEDIPWSETADIWAPPGESFVAKKTDAWSELLAKRKQEDEEQSKEDNMEQLMIPKCLDEVPIAPPVGFDHTTLSNDGSHQSHSEQVDSLAKSMDATSIISPKPSQPQNLPALDTSKERTTSSSSTASPATGSPKPQPTQSRKSTSSGFSLFKRWKKPSISSASQIMEPPTESQKDSSSKPTDQTTTTSPVQSIPTSSLSNFDLLSESNDPLDRSLNIIAQQNLSSSSSSAGPQLDLAGLQALAASKNKNVSSPANTNNPTSGNTYSASSKLQLLPDDDNGFSTPKSTSGFSFNIAPPPAPSSATASSMSGTASASQRSSSPVDLL